MAVKTNAIATGTVVRVTERSGKTQAGKDWSMTNVLIVGDHTLVDATVGMGLDVPKQGDVVTGVIEVGVYRDDDSVSIIEWIRAPKAGN